MPDRTVLRGQLHRAQRLRVLGALLLIAPLFLWVLVNFVVPVAIILFKSVDDREVSTVLARASAALARWDGNGVPDEAVFAAFAVDLRQAQASNTLHIAAKRLGSARSDLQALLNRTARGLPDAAPSSWGAALAAIDERWADPALWRLIRQTGNPITPIHLLGAVDLTMNDDGAIVPVSEERRVLLLLWGRTVWIALVVTVVCIIAGYPLAFVIANAPARAANLMLMLVLLPFWMSLLVRTTAWVVLLQTQGVLNDLAIFLHLWTERLQLIHNRTGVYVTMTHVLLPYMVLPLYGIMKRIPPSYMRAAMSLGANPAVAFARVYFPLTIHGVGAGALLVFILAVGYYVTPALVGGRSDQMISYFVAFYANVTLNWGPAAALSALLLVFTIAAFWIFKAVFGLDRMRVS